jgi:predicted phosphoribosyltransferase
MMIATGFTNRTEGGVRLAEKLARFANRDDVIVLGLPRGGVPVAAEVAAALGAPLDVFVVRKLGTPGHAELAMGAIASGGVRVLNRDVIDAVGVTDVEIDLATRREEAELLRRERAYRGGRPASDVREKTVIVVDDGIATGSTMLAAVEALRKLGAGRIVVATPTAAGSSRARIAREADEVACVLVPEDFSSVGEWYEDFPQTTDDEVTAILSRAP